MKTLRKLAFFVIGAAALGSTSGCGWEQIPPASVGVRFNATQGISEHILQPRVVFVGPFDRLIIYPTSTKNATYVKKHKEGEKQGDDSIKASTLEGAILPIDLTVAWHVSPDDVPKVFQNFGGEEPDQIQHENIRWVTNFAVNNISGKRSIFDILAKDRGHFGQEVLQEIRPRLEAWGLTVDNVYVGEMYPPQEVATKIQERTAAKNDLELAKTEQKQATTEARTRLINAQKEAEQAQLLGQQGSATTLIVKRLEIRRAAIAKWKAAGGHVPLIGESRIPFSNTQVR